MTQASEWLKGAWLPIVAAGIVFYANTELSAYKVDDLARQVAKEIARLDEARREEGKRLDDRINIHAGRLGTMSDNITSLERLVQSTAMEGMRELNSKSDQLIAKMEKTDDVREQRSAIVDEKLDTVLQQSAVNTQQIGQLSVSLDRLADTVERVIQGQAQDRAVRRGDERGPR